MDMAVKSAEGEMETQELKGEGEKWSAETEINKQQTLMDSQMSQMKMHGEEKDKQDKKMWSGIEGAIKGIGGPSGGTGG